MAGESVVQNTLKKHKIHTSTVKLPLTSCSSMGLVCRPICCLCEGAASSSSIPTRPSPRNLENKHFDLLLICKFVRGYI